MFNHNLFFIDIHLAHIELLITRTQVLYLSKFCNDPMIGWTTPKIGIYAIVRNTSVYYRLTTLINMLGTFFK